MSITEHNDVSKDETPARRLEIFTGAGRRRIWTAEDKASIVAESYEHGARVIPTAVMNDRCEPIGAFRLR